MHNFMKIVNTLSVVVISFFTLFSASADAQEKGVPLTKKEQRTVIDSIGIKLNENYIFPEVAKKMSESIQLKLKQGDYTSIQDPQEFSNVLTTDLVAISKDKHIRVSFDPRIVEEQQEAVSAEDSIAYLNSYINGLRQANFGFKEIKILDGNIGYLDLRSFSDVEYAGETAVAAMNFLSNTDAMIIDLRFNGGGSPAMIQLITSYLFKSNPIHLNSFYWRPSDEKSQTWTLPHVPGKRSPDTPVYVLTSRSTFSAAEEFSYNLKNLERATLVGETTGGGAHPGGPVRVTDRFTVWVPIGRAINPITNTNWEGTGVTPHIEVSAGKALEAAQIDALEVLLKESDDAALKKFYAWNLSAIKSVFEPVVVEKSMLTSYVGSYGPRVVWLENDILYYQRDGGNVYELIPLNVKEFQLKGMSSFRISFVSENGQIIALEGNSDQGYSDRNLKNKE
jgi:C-terminal processing protease CtpA/Prc